MKIEEIRPAGKGSDSGEPSQAAESVDVVARLVRLTGEPRSVPGDAAGRVRDHVHGAWRAGIRRRRRRRYAAVAAMLIAAAGSWLVTREPTLQGPLATLRAVQGGGLLSAEPVDTSFGRTRLETGAGRAALELADGSSLRLDRSTRFELLASRRLRLEAGALYLDASGDEPFTIETPFGDVHDIGTQFEVSLDAGGVRVRVREGLVDVQGPDGSHSAAAGDEIKLGPGGALSRRPVASHGEPWQPYLDVAPTYALEGSTLESYLEWLRRETGWRLEFRDPSIQTASRTIVLHGSLEGLSVTETPLPVLRTCGLGGRIEDGVLEIFSLGHEAPNSERQTIGGAA